MSTVNLAKDRLKHPVLQRVETAEHQSIDDTVREAPESNEDDPGDEESKGEDETKASKRSYALSTAQSRRISSRMCGKVFAMLNSALSTTSYPA